jgi:hypothetical protein
MARSALLVLGVLLTASVWLWLRMDPAPIAPAIAYGNTEHRGAAANEATVATGAQVSEPEATQAELSNERTVAVVSAKRYMIRGAVASRNLDVKCCAQAVGASSRSRPCPSTMAR